MSSSANAEALKFKEGDEPRFPLLHAQTTDKLLLASSDGRFYTLAADKLPGGRGFGEPVKADGRHRRRGQCRRPAARRRAPRNCCSPRRTGAASSPRRRARSPRPARASRSSTCAPARGCKVVRPIERRRRLCRGGRREPQAGRLSARRAARNGPRPGRPAAALPRRRPCRRDRLHASPRACPGRWAARAAAPAPRPT